MNHNSGNAVRVKAALGQLTSIKAAALDPAASWAETDRETQESFEVEILEDALAEEAA